MANNYLQPVNNHFGDLNGDDLQDIDDDIFLNNSRKNSTISGRGSATAAGVGGSSLSARSSNPFEDQQQMYAEKRRQIESRTLDSTQRSLGLLYETEEVGKATAVELAKQREQLEKTSKNLDDINTTLRFSQRHLNGLKSVFGGLKNYLSGNRDLPTRNPSAMSGTITENGLPNADAVSSCSNNHASKPTLSPTERYDNHPISRIRENSSVYQQREQTQEQRRNNPFEAQLESNLEEMCGNLSRLKYLATDLGSEIESQNELLDNMNYKIEDVDVKIGKQNKEMNKLLGKK